MADFEDLFDGTLDTNLTDHTPDVGTGWTGGGSTTDNARLTGNGELKAESNEALHVIKADDLGSPDHQVWFELNSGAGSYNSRICARHQDDGNYAAGVARDLGDIRFSSRDGGSTNALATVDISEELSGYTLQDEPVWIRIKCEGDTITFWGSIDEPASPEEDTNWTLLHTETVTVANTVQTPGLQLFGSSGGNTDHDPWIGTFKASALSGGGDTAAPTLTNATASADGSDGYSSSVDTDEGNGTLYHVVDQSATAPTKAEVKAGNGEDGSAADASGNQAVSATGTQNVGQTGVLAASTTYYIHYMHEDSSGNQSSVASTASFTTDAADTTAPTLSSATVDDAALTLAYNEALDEASVPATGDFTVTGSSSGTISVSGVGVSGTDVNLTLASAVAVGETVDLDYTPGTNPIQDEAGNDAASLTDEPVTNNTTSDLSYTTNDDSMNVTETGTSITNPGTSEPEVNFTVRAQNDHWRNYYFRLDNANGKRPVFEFDASEVYQGAADMPLDRRSWYTYDDPTSVDATWTRWDSDMTNPSGDLRRFQLGTSFTQDTVYIASEPAYPVARARNLIQWFEDNRPDMLHRPPSVGDDAEWSTGTVSSQTDTEGNTIPAQPMYAFGVWDSTVYPDDGLPKRTVVLTGGHHAGEVGGNHVLDEFLKFLASSDSAAVALRKNFQFFIYPMLNPIGRWGGARRYSFEDPTTDPNRDMVDQSLEMTQVFVAAFNKDFPGRTIPFHVSFHSDNFNANRGGGTEQIYFYEGFVTAANTAWESAVSTYGDYGFISSGVSTGLREFFDSNYSTDHAYVLEHMPQNANFTAYSEFTKSGQDTAKALNDLWDAEKAGQLAYAGNYVAETLNGSATVGRQLDAAVYPWPPKPADTPVKVERGLGADSSRAFRMDMGNDTGDVFVVLSSVDYENANSDAAAGANKVTVQST